MPSATVDNMVINVAGALVGAVGLVVWLWIADVCRLWPFNGSVRAEDLVHQHVALQTAGMVPALAFAPVHHHHHVRRQPASVRWAARTAARRERRLGSHAEPASRRGLRRTVRPLALAY